MLVDEISTFGQDAVPASFYWIIVSINGFENTLHLHQFYSFNGG